MYKLTNRAFHLSGQGTVSLLQGTRELWVDAGMRDRLSCNPLGARDCQSLYWFTAVHSASEFSSVQAQPVELCRFKTEFRQSSYIIWAFFTELRVINRRKKYNHWTQITSIKELHFRCTTWVWATKKVQKIKHTLCPCWFLPRMDTVSFEEDLLEPTYKLVGRFN